MDITSEENKRCLAALKEAEHHGDVSRAMLGSGDRAGGLIELARAMDAVADYERAAASMPLDDHEREVSARYVAVMRWALAGIAGNEMANAAKA